MAITIEAVYEDGFLKPAHALPLKEHEKVTVTIQPSTSPLMQAYGILGWKGSVEDADRFAMDPELDFPPPLEAP